MIFTNEVPSTNMDWKYVWGEVQELIIEVKALNLIGIRNEMCDVYTCLMCAIARYTNIPMPISWMRSANNWVERLTFWNQYFKELGLEFNVKYVKNGSNYKKPEKRRKAVELALKEQVRKE